MCQVLNCQGLPSTHPSSTQSTHCNEQPSHQGASQQSKKSSSCVVCVCVFHPMYSQTCDSASADKQAGRISFGHRGHHRHTLASAHLRHFNLHARTFLPQKNTWINKIRNLKRSGVEVKSVVALATGKACCNNTVRQNCPTCTFAHLHKFQLSAVQLSAIAQTQAACRIAQTPTAAASSCCKAMAQTHAQHVAQMLIQMRISNHCQKKLSRCSCLS